jgi:hypothetical protein
LGVVIPRSRVRELRLWKLVELGCYMLLKFLKTKQEKEGGNERLEV